MIAVVEYEAGNVRSVLNALRRCGIGDPVLTAREDLLKAADKVILPGVGDASVALESLRRAGLDRIILALERPVLGICVGTQILCERTEEGNAEGLGIFRTAVRRFRPSGDLKIPHIQFNVVRREDLLAAKEHPEQYRSLTVRVAGYTAYFVELDGKLQDEIIRRTAYDSI